MAWHSPARFFLFYVFSVWLTQIVPLHSLPHDLVEGMGQYVSQW